MIQIAAAVKLDLLLQSHLSHQVAPLRGLFEALQGGVEVADVGGVVFLVVQAHDFGGDDRLEGVEVVRQVGEGVFGASLLHLEEAAGEVAHCSE